MRRDNAAYILLNQIHEESKKVFAIYNEVARSPENWREESEQLKKIGNRRAEWVYRSVDLSPYRARIAALRSGFSHVSQQGETLYDTFAFIVAEATLHTAEVKIAFLEQLMEGSLPLPRKETHLYRFTPDYKEVQDFYKKNSTTPLLKEIGKRFSYTELSPEEAKEILEQAIENARKQVVDVIDFPADQQTAILQAFTAKVFIKDDPSFLMRCITDPGTGEIHILLSAQKKYSRGLLRIGFFHEFCGHALESALFDGVLIPQGVCHSIYSNGGVSSPNIFDVKAEGFADLMMAPFLTGEDKEFLNYRLNVWIPTRAYADWLYHVEGATFEQIVDVFRSVGLEGFAHDEALMITLFFDGMQSMYFFGRKQLIDLQKKLNWDQKQFLTAVLFAGKIPHDHLGHFLALPR